MSKCLAFLVAVTIAAPILALSAESESQPLDELNEVVVSATRPLSDRILALENSFYQR